MKNKKLIFLLTFCVKILLSQQPVYLDSSQYSVQLSKWAPSNDYTYPFIIDSTLFYISNAPYEQAVKNFDLNGKPLYRIYCENLKLKQPKAQQLFKGLLKQNHEGPFYINKAKDHVWFTTNKINTQDENILTIKEAIKINNKWLIKTLPFLDSIVGSSCHPFLYDNDNKIIFSADIKNAGFGGMDLYSAEKINGTWQNIKNLGDAVNSAQNEVFPVITSNNELIYSSNKNKKDLDFYSFSFLTKQSARLSAPFNSPANETGISFSPAENCHYISSDRQGPNRIYKVKFTWPVSLPSDTISSQTYCYEFAEESSVGLNDTSKAVYEWNFGDGLKSRGLVVNHCYQNAGTYTISLNIIDKSTGILFFNQVNYEMEVADSFLFHSAISNDTLTWYKKSAADSVKRVYVEADNVPVYAGLSKEIVVPHGWKVIKEFYSVVTNHKADTVCRIRYRIHNKNQAKDTLLRIMQPPDLNFKIHLGSSDSTYALNPLQVLLNDTVISMQTSDKKYHYFAGNYADIDSTFNPVSSIRKKGFPESTVIAFNKDSLIKNQMLKGSLTTKKECMHLYSVTYKPSGYNLAEEHQSSLKSLVNQFKNKQNVKLVIVSTTDATGSKKFNEALSQKRSAEVFNYLQALGFKKSNILLQTKIVCESDRSLQKQRESKIYLTYEK